MPFCPECHDEYRPGFTHCVDCGVELVEYLPETPAESSDVDEVSEPPVAVYETSDYSEADVLRSKLEFYGVPAALSGELAQRSVYNPMSLNLFGPIQILVPADRIEEARQILEESDEP